MRGRCRVVFAALLPLLGSCGGEAPLRIGAAASLSDVLPPLIDEFCAQTGLAVELLFGGSGRLVVQAEQGAPIDLLLLAGAAPMDRLEEKDLLVAGTRSSLFENRLVLVVRQDDPAQAGASVAAWFLDQANGPVAIGAHGVPAGDYARRWVAGEGVEDSAVKLVPLTHVRAVLAAVGSSACRAGFVYETDISGEGLRVIAIAEPSQTGPIRYPIAVLAKSRHREAALRLLRFLEDRAEAFHAAGFRPAGHAE